MRVLLVSKQGNSLGIASHLSSEGHSVNFAIPTHDLERQVDLVGSGVVERSVSTHKADYVVFDNSAFAEDADSLEANGHKHIGASLWGKLVSSDPDYVKALAVSMGWPYGPLQGSINLYTTLWFNGAEYIAVYNSLVYRRLMSGGRGPDVNFTGVIGCHKPVTKKLNDLVLEPLIKVLKKVNHRGCIHLHFHVLGEAFSLVEMSASLDYPLSFLLLENSKLSVSDMLLRLLNETSSAIIPIDTWSAGVMISIPPYPYALEPKETPIKGIVPGNLKHLWLVDASKEQDNWITGRLNGKIGYVTARGATVFEAVRRAYRTISNLQVEDLQYRDDVGRDLRGLLDRLKLNGWLN